MSPAKCLFYVKKIKKYIFRKKGKKTLPFSRLLTALPNRGLSRAQSGLWSTGRGRICSMSSNYPLKQAKTWLQDLIPAACSNQRQIEPETSIQRGRPH